MASNKYYTEAEHSFIRENFAAMSLEEMAEKLGRTVQAVKIRTIKLGLRRKSRFNWTPDRIQILKEMYPDRPTREIAARLGAKVLSATRKASRLGLKKDPAYLKNLNRQMGENLQKSGYGHKPHNTCKVGDIRKPKDYWKIKLADPNIWEFLHIYIWTQKHGKPTKGMCVVFKDGNRDNCVIENLELITRSELMLRSSIHNLPPEIVEVKQMLGRLTREINKKRKIYAEEN